MKGKDASPHDVPPAVVNTVVKVHRLVQEAGFKRELAGHILASAVILYVHYALCQAI